VCVKEGTSLNDKELKEMEAKLIAFLEGLEMENIEELVKKDPDELKLVGEVMSNEIKALKLLKLNE
jgi:hypothetical protein